MVQVILDPSNYKEYVPLENGVYEARIDTSQVLMKKSDKGTEYVPVKFIVENHEEYAGHVRTRNCPTTGDGANITLKMVKTLGLWDGDKSKKVKLNFKDMNGLPCRIRIEQREYQGKIMDDIAEVLPPSEEQMAKAAKKKAASF